MKDPIVNAHTAYAATHAAILEYLNHNRGVMPDNDIFDLCKKLEKAERGAMRNSNRVRFST